MAIKNRMNDHNPAKPPVTSNIPQVSIGMPVYNGAKFIHEALDSLLAQTFTDFELIISDNASTDETEAICREYAAKDSRIRYVRQSTNLGAVANFQFVLDEAVGEYFMWAAADDVWSIIFIEKALIGFSHNHDVIASITKCIFGDNTNAAGDNSFMHNFVFNRRISFLLNPGPNARFYSLFKKSVLVAYKITDYNFHAGDWAFIFDILGAGKFHTDIDQVGFYKRDEGFGSDKNKIKHTLLALGGNKFFPLKDFVIYLYEKYGFKAFFYILLVLHLNYYHYLWLKR